MQRISLVVSTVDRVEPLPQLLQSLVDQQMPEVIEVILVDQNQDARLAAVFQEFSDKLQIRWIGAHRGLSRARNAGLRVVGAAPVIGFPDDDCQYPSGFLVGLLAEFASSRADFVSVRQVGPNGETDARPPSRATEIHRYNVWRACGSNVTFYKAGAIQAIGEFDETLGLGAGTTWEGGEDIDYPIRALGKGLRGWFAPSLHVLHAGSIARGSGPSARRTFGYNAAMGRIWKQHGYPVWWLIYQGMRALGGLLIGASRGDVTRVRYHWEAFRGRLAGWIRD